MKKNYMKPAMQVVNMRHRSGICGSAKVKNMTTNLGTDGFSIDEEGSDGEARAKQRGLWSGWD
jgi:hypothetical protein